MTSLRCGVYQGTADSVKSELPNRVAGENQGRGTREPQQQKPDLIGCRSRLILGRRTAAK